MRAVDLGENFAHRMQPHQYIYYLQGIIKSFISLLISYSGILDTHSITTDNTSLSAFNLCNSGIDFSPVEVMKGDKTAG